MQLYESGNIKNIKHQTIAQWAEILKCSPAYLMGWENTIQQDESFRLSDLEKQIILAFRQADEISKAMVLRALSIDESVFVKGEPAKMA